MAPITHSPRITRPLLCAALSLVAGFAGLAPRGHAAVPTPQITGPISNQQRVTLHGNVRPLPRNARDLGTVAANLPTGRVQLLLKRPAAQQAELTQFLEDVHTPGSAVYHKWLTPAELGAQYGPAEADVQAVVSWLGTQGFAVTRINQARTAIEFTGTAGQLQHTFGAQLHSFQVGSEQHISNTTNPQIPAALAPVVAGLSPLNDFRLKPMHTVAAARVADAAPTSTNPHAFAVRPDLTRPNTNGVPEFYVTPGDLATIYNIPNSALNKHYAASANLTGSGVQVGIAGVSNVDLSNVSNYRTLLGLGSGTPPTVTVDGSDPGVQGDNAVEALLDLEQVSAVAPDATVTLYIAQDTTFQQGLFLAIQRALDDNKVGILNVSFGGCEAYQTQAGNQQVLNFWQQAAAQGITVTVSTGDSDAAGCDSADAMAANQGLQVNALASTPYNIAVGGTDFNETQATSAQYWSATNSTIFESAIGPIPEIPWNNSTTTTGGFAQNVASHDSNGSTRIDGAGGGVSGCLNGTVDNAGNVTACAGAYAQPSFQSGFGSGTVRQLPDVSMFAANGGHQASYLLCASGLGGDQPNAQDCVGANGTFGFQAVGGTSASSPVFAGVLALASQSLGGARLGQAAYTLYPLSRQHAAAFHDITLGNNSALCTGGTPNCGSNSFLTGYDAATGYDLATGLGSVDVTQLVQNWGSVTYRGTSTALQLNGSSAPVTITHGTPVQVAVSVSGSGGTPSGNVALVNNSSTPGTSVAAVQNTAASPSVFTLANGSASGSYAFLPGGSYAVQANYAGDGVFAGSTSNPINVTVNPEASTLDFGVLDFQVVNKGSSSNANGGSFPYGTYLSVFAEPVSTAKASSTAPQALATGIVSFTSSSPQLNQMDALNSNGFAEIANQSNLAYPPGAYSVSASYGGDPSFSPSSAGAQGFTIVKADTFSLPVALPAAASGTLTVEVDPNIQQYFTNAGAAAPGGTVTVTNGSGTTLGTAALAPVNGSVAQANVNVTQLGNSIGITYGGDTNYNAPPAVTCALGQFALCAPSANVTVPRGSSATALVSLTPQGNFTGTVNLSCSVGKGSGTTPTCALSQSSVSLNNGAQVVGLTLNAAATSELRYPGAPRGGTTPGSPSSGSPSWYTAGGAALAGLLLLGLPGRRRHWQRMLSLLIVIGAIGFAGCGGGSSKSGSGSGSGGSGGSTTGNYVVTVTATSGATSETSTVNIVVQ